MKHRRIGSTGSLCSSVGRRSNLAQVRLLQGTGSNQASAANLSNARQDVDRGHEFSAKCRQHECQVTLALRIGTKMEYQVGTNARYRRTGTDRVCQVDMLPPKSHIRDFRL